MSGFRLTTLPNGLRIASERLPGVSTVTVAVSVDVGSRDERAEEQGVAHLLEHMAFKGTQSFNARQLAEAFDDIGGQNNAYTSAEQTVYYAKVMAEDHLLAVRILGDILTHSTFAEDELERERGVILQEIAMHLDMPEELIGDRFQEAAFADQPLGRSILGTESHIAAFTRDDLLSYMRRGYGPDHMIISAAGDLDHERLVQVAEEAFADLAPAARPVRELARYTGGEFRQTEDFEQVHLLFGLPGLAYNDPDYYALQLLNTMLGGGISSRLFQEVREVRGLAYHVQSFASAYTDSGTFGIYAATGEHQVPELIPVVAEQLLLMTEQVSEAELRRAQKQHIAGLAMARESTTAVAEWIGRHLLLHGEYRTIPLLTERILAVTDEQLRRTAARLFDAGPLTLAALGPVTQVESYDAVAARFKR